MKICKNCKCKNTDDSNFCENCGQRLTPDNVVPPKPPKPAKEPKPPKPVKEPKPPKPPKEPKPPKPSKEPKPAKPPKPPMGPGAATQGPTDNGMQQAQAAPQKKGNGGFIALIIIGVVVIVAALLAVGFLLFRNRLPALFQRLIPCGQIQEVLEQPDDSEEADPEADREPEEQPEDGPEAEKPESSQEAEQPENSQKAEQPKDYANVDMNGVDNAYLIVNGTLAQAGDRMVLVLPAPKSAAVESNGRILKIEGVVQLLLSGEIKGESGAEVSVKGKLSADEADNLMLEIVSMDVTKEPVVPADNPAELHRYEVIQEDVTWQEAYAACIQKGGYLVRINSEEEYQALIQLIEEADMQKVHFFLGGLRKEDSQEYYWVDENGMLMEPVLNPGGPSWAAGHWMENEPSFTSEDDIEMYMNLVYYKENWVLNDVPIDITMYYPGRTGYIVEYEN